MASLVLGAVGGFFFGPIGFAIGSMIGSLLFPPQTQGPRLTDLKLTNSSYGVPIPLIYGAMRVTPNIIWQTDLHEHEHGGKGGPSVTTFSYTASFAMQLCANEIQAINRIWWNGTLIWNADGSVGDAIPCTVYLGTEDQLADPTMEAVLGVGNVPGYRGTAYVVFNEYDLTSGGNTIGNWSFEVIQHAAPGELAIVNANYATGFTFAAYANIHAWETTADIPVISDNTLVPGSVTAPSPEDFDPATLAFTGAHVGTVVFPGWVDTIAASDYLGIGVYVYADGRTTLLWYSMALFEITASDINPTIYTSSASFPFFSGVYHAQDPARFLYSAGIPAGLFAYNAALSQDGTQLFVFTATSSITPVAHWWKIVDGLVVADGAIDSSLATMFSAALGPWSSVAKVHGVVGDPSICNTASFENNGQFMWYMQGTNSTVHLLAIDGTGTLVDSGLTPLTIPFQGTGTNKGIEGSIQTLSTPGFAGVARGHNLLLLSRLGPASTGIPLSEIVSDLSVRAGLTTTQIDVSALPDIVDGYLIAQQMSARDGITPLQSAWYFDAVERAGVVIYVKRGGDPVLTIPDGDLAAQAPSGQPPPLITITRAQEVDLPAVMNVKYVNAANDYQTGTQLSQRQVTNSQLQSSIELAINMTDTKAKQVANTILFMSWWERVTATILTSRQYAYLEPTDVIQARGQQYRVANKNDIASNIEQLDLVAAISNIWDQGPTAVGTSGFTPSSPPAKQQAQLVLLDIPMLVDTDHQQGLYAAMAGASSDAWAGANLYKSVDGGATYNLLGSESIAAVIGVVTDPLGDFLGGNVFDEINTAEVTVGLGGGDLSSVNELAVLNGENAAMIGGEMLQYKNAVLTAPSVYLLSGFLRGRRGTEFSIPTHVQGEQFVSLPDLDVDAPFNELAQVRQYKAVSFGTSIASAAPVSFINYGAKLRPYSPTDIGGGVNVSGDVTINWTRRTRIGGAWADFTDVILSEPSEAYVLQIWSEHFQQVARIVNVTAPTFVYTSAMQVTDFGGQQQTIFVSIGQVGTYTLGTQATGEIPGAGGSNSAPLNPQTPYNNPPPQTGTGCSGTVVNTTLSAGVYAFSGDGAGGPGWTWVLKFTTGSIAAGIGKIIAFAGSGDQLPMGGTLTIEPCGFPLPPTVTRLPLSSLVQFSYYMTGNPNPGKFPTLLPGTDYYLSVTRPAIGPAMSAIWEPPT